VLQELAARTGAQVWAVASMLFFLLAYLVAAAVAWGAGPGWAARCARLPLAADDPSADGDRDTPGHPVPRSCEADHGPV
jgi:hypothetical protein